MKIATPDTSHLSQKEFEEVYEPAEDSFLLLDALELELDKIQPPSIVVEVGSGSGIISSALSTCFPSALVLSTDLNPAACSATSKTAEKNQNSNIEVVRTDFLTCLIERLRGSVDLLVCNPPYVATHTDELGSQGIAASWAGGDLGLNLTRRVVEKLSILLSSSGVSYLVLEQCNKPEEFMQEIRDKFKLNCQQVLSRRAGREYLIIIRVNK